MMKFCVDQKIAVIPWSPMARGFLVRSAAAEGAATARERTDAYARELGLGSRQDEAIRRRVFEVAEKLGAKPASVALAWALSKPFVTAPIVGASKPRHLEDAVAALSLKLDARAIARLEELYRPKAVVGHA
jgi:aryl-alcohol dehydrogenase-like predicted oxidoreductase